MRALPASLQAALLLAVTWHAQETFGAGHWGYSEHDGPEHWPGMCQTGTYQSPIDLGSSGISTGHFEKLMFLNYDRNYNATAINNGHTIQIQITDPHNVMILGGGLNRLYSLEQIHFHWQSEHTIMDQRYPLEVHFVHFDQKHRKLSNAADKKGGIAVIGVLFREAEGELDNVNLEFFNNVNNLKYNNTRNIKFSLKSLLPDDSTKFFRYYGSLTTPGCAEVVVWTVLEATVPISKRQLMNFRNLHDSNGKIMYHNYRPIQEKNDRIIYYQTEPPKEVPYTDSATSLQSSIVPTIVLLVYVTIFGNKCT